MSKEPDEIDEIIEQALIDAGCIGPFDEPLEEKLEHYFGGEAKWKLIDKVVEIEPRIKYEARSGESEE